MREAFNFMFKDNMFKQKALPLLGILFIANIFTNIASSMAPARGAAPSINYTVFVILGLLFLFISNGYFITNVKSFIEQKENIILPFVNIKNNFILGFKQSIAIMIAVLLFFLVGVIAVALITVFSGLTKLYVIGSILPPILITSAIIAFIFYLIAFCYIFATTEKFTSFLQFKKATGMIKPVAKHYILTLLLTILVSVLTGIFNAAISALFIKAGIVGIILITIFESVVGVYCLYVYSYLIAKAL